METFQLILVIGIAFALPFAVRALWRLVSYLVRYVGMLIIVLISIAGAAWRGEIRIDRE